ncbi:MAG: permease-like cell division protein FtsX [Candidatus Moraniibacteriota bacterium]
MQQVSLKLWRTWKEGFQYFIRNGWLTFAAVIILTLSLFVGAFSIIAATSAKSALNLKRESLSIAVSLNADISEDRIREIEGDLKQYKEIASIQYISRDDALSELLARNGNDDIIKRAVDTIGENPLLPTLVIRASDPSHYELIANKLKDSIYQSDINRINYERNKKIIDRLSSASRTIDLVGFAVSSVLILVSFIITFYAILITIRSNRQEFEIMRLVGASNLYVRMPVIFQGILYGVISAILSFILLGIAFKFLAPHTTGLFATSTILSFYFAHFLPIFAGLLGSGIALGVVSSEVAVRGTLKV